MFLYGALLFHGLFQWIYIVLNRCCSRDTKTYRTTSTLFERLNLGKTLGDAKGDPLCRAS